MITSCSSSSSPSLNDKVDLSEYPALENCMPPDVFEITVEQKPPEISELSVAIPLSCNWPRLQETATHDPATRFTAKLPLSSCICLINNSLQKTCKIHLIM